MGRNEVCFIYSGWWKHDLMFYRSAPITNLTFPTSTETIISVKFNMSESSVLASVGSDRTFTLYDIRTGKAERRVVMQVRIFLLRNLVIFLQMHSIPRCKATPSRGPRHSLRLCYLRQKTTIYIRLISGTLIPLHRFIKPTLPQSCHATGAPRGRSS